MSTESLSDNDTVGTEEGIEFEESQSKKKRVTFLLFPPVLHVYLIRFKYNAQASRSEKCNDRRVLNLFLLFCVHSFDIQKVYLFA